MSQRPTPNVVVFGGTGAGKSSVINMLKGSKPAKVSSSAMGVTTGCDCYVKTINGETFNVYDTPSLSEGTAGRVSAVDAIQLLHNLIRQLSDGVNLLVFVMRAPRITALAQKNYQMLFDIICERKVPIVIVITGLEREGNLDQWWPDNKASFDLQRMLFHGHACITAVKGAPGGREAQVYEKSKNKLADLIQQSYSERLWKAPERTWFYSTIENSSIFLASILPISIPSCLSF